MTDAKVLASFPFVTSVDVRTVVIGVIEHFESWVDKMLQCMVRFPACFTETPKLRGLLVDVVGKFSDIFAKNVFDEIAVVLPRVEIQVVDRKRISDDQHPKFSWCRALQYRRLTGSASSVSSADVHHELVSEFVTGKSDFFQLWYIAYG